MRLGREANEGCRRTKASMPMPIESAEGCFLRRGIAFSAGEPAGNCDCIRTNGG
jgi:hypothetical protein